MEKLLVDRVEQEFLRDINANVTDDGVRLIYADYLEDHGEPEKAEFIRLQIKRYQEQLETPSLVVVSEREIELWQAHSDKWYRSCESGLRHVLRHVYVPGMYSRTPVGVRSSMGEVERGFLHFVSCSIEVFDRYGKWLGECYPLDSLSLVNVSPDLALGYRFWVCKSWSNIRPHHHVPFYLYPDVSVSSYVWYDTHEEAMADLTRRALNWAKGIPND